MKEIYIKSVNGEHSLVCETPYVLSARNIEDAMKNLYNIKVDDLADLFWEGNYANDCYKTLHFRDGIDAGMILYMLPIQKRKKKNANFAMLFVAFLIITSKKDILMNIFLSI